MSTHPDPRQVSVGILSGFTDLGVATIEFGRGPGRSRSLSAESIIALSEEDVGRCVAVLWNRWDTSRPVIIGLIEASSATGRLLGDSASDPQRTWEVEVDRLTLVATAEIELRCGEASITLTREGKVTIRGTNVLSRSRGLNRIKGAAVQIN